MRGVDRRERIRRKVLLPLTLTLIFFLGLFLSVSYLYLQKNIRRDLEQQYKTADILLEDLVVQRTELMDLAVRQVAAAPDLQRTMRERRRDELARLASPLSTLLQTRYGISHLYFHTPEGVTFLRMHEPDRHGDPVLRETFERARRTMVPARGLELGPLGAFSLRLVIPWFAGGELIGFIEVGEDIEQLIEKLHEIARFDMVVFLRKSLLERTAWEKRMRLQGREPNWDRFVDRVASFHSLPEIAPELAGALARQGFWTKQEIAVELGGRSLRGRFLPLQDGRNRRVGEILILRDVSRAVDNFDQSMFLVTVFCALFGGSLFASAFFLLGRTDRDLSFARRQLMDEIKRAGQANLQLEQEVAERRQAEQALKDARDLLEIRVRERTAALDLRNKLLGNLIRHIPFHVYWKDRHLAYQGCNPGFAALMEMADELRFIGLSNAELPWNPGQREQIDRLEKEVLRTGEPIFDHELLWQGEGKETILLYSLVPLKDAGGNLTGLLGIFQDITDRKQREEELRQALADARQAGDRLSILVCSVDDILFAVDAENRLLLMNPSAEPFLGRRMEHAMGRSLEEVITDPDLLGKVRQALLVRRPGQFDLEVGTGGLPGAPRILQARTSVLGGERGEFEGMIFLIQDVTEERTMDRLKSDFISTAAHELRTPMAVILGYSELLLSEDPGPEERREFLSVIYERADAISSLLDDLLDISRIESGQPLALRREPIPVGELFDRTVEHYRKSAPLHRIELALEDGDRQLVADRGKMWQVIENLVNNAVKYSPHGGSVCIHGRRSGEGYRVTVQDEGIGMTPEQVRQVFQKFYRADTSNTAIHGTGLGLTIVKHIVEAHGGNVWVESEPGRGTAVSFLIPAA